MIWQDEMKWDAARIALPDWELRDDDYIDIKFEYHDYWEEACCHDPDCCPDNAPAEEFVVTVQVTRADKRNTSGMEYRDAGAAQFLYKLMRLESADNVSALDVMVRIAKREALNDVHYRAAVRESELRSARDIYEQAMFYASLNDEQRATVHDLAQNHGGSPVAQLVEGVRR